MLWVSSRVLSCMKSIVPWPQVRHCHWRLRPTEPYTTYWLWHLCSLWKYQTQVGGNGHTESTADFPKEHNCPYFPRQYDVTGKSLWTLTNVNLVHRYSIYLDRDAGEGAYLSSSMKWGEQEPRDVSCKPLARCLVYNKSSAIISSFPTPFPFINLNFNILTLLWVHLPSKGKVSTNTSIAYSTLKTEQLEL